MMGMVFTELLEMVEAKFSLDVVDAVLARAGAKGSYTSVGNYEDAEMVAIVTALSEETGLPVPALLQAFGGYMFGRFLTGFPAFFEAHDNALGFLRGLESHVHTEVRKLYPAAHPPLFTWADEADGGLSLVYRSRRGLWQFAQGLLDACLLHYGGQHYLDEIVDLSHGQGQKVRFVIRAAAGRPSGAA